MKRFLFILAIIFAFLCLSKCQLQEETKIPLSIPYELHHVVPEIITAYHREGNREEIEVFEYHSKELKDIPKIGIHIIDSWKRSLKNPILQSPLVIIGTRKIYSLEQLKDSSISLPDPDINTTGLHAINLLKEQDLWLNFKRNITYKNKGILSMESVDLAEEDFAIVSLVDTYFMKNSFIVLDLPKEEYNTFYSIQNYDKNKEEQKKFIDFLTSEKSMKIFQKYGFFKVTSEDSSKSEK